MAALAALCVLAGVFPGVAVDAISAAVRPLLGTSLAPQSGIAWMTLVPVSEARGTYSGLLVFVFIAVSAGAAAWAVRRLGSREASRGPAWDCGFPLDDPTTQYGAGSFAQPVRRVLGSVLVRAREEVEMPPPGSLAPARHRALTRDLVWEGYLRVAGGVTVAAVRMNRLQFLTIRRYLSLVMATLVGLLLVLTIWR
jgi:hypothetical protein